MQVVILGGGIAGVTCLETLVGHGDQVPQGTQVTIVSATPLLRRAVMCTQLGRYVSAYRVEETSSDEWRVFPWVRVQVGIVEQINVAQRYVRLRMGDAADVITQLPFDFLCICMGALPRIPKAVSLASARCSAVGERVLTIRDTDSVERFRALLARIVRDQHRKSANDARIVIVGNGGIAMELAYVLQDIARVDWVIRDDHLGQAFFDAAVSDLLWSLPTRNAARRASARAWLLSRRDDMPPEWKIRPVVGAGLGPDWMRGGSRDRKELLLWPEQASAHLQTTLMQQHFESVSAAVDESQAANTQQEPVSAQLRIHRDCTVVAVDWQTPRHDHGSETATDNPSVFRSEDARLRIVLSQGEELEADLLLCATGVRGAVGPQYLDSEGQKWLRWTHFNPSPAPTERTTSSTNQPSIPDNDSDDMGIAVDERMSTGVTHIYAAGDCCVVQRESSADDGSPSLWFQMRLWSQAKMMGARAARSIVRELCSCHQQQQQRLAPESDSYGNRLMASSPVSDDALLVTCLEPLDMELFCHVTEFCGIKVVLLGLYRAQGLEPSSVHILESLRPSDEADAQSWQYVRVILWKNRLVGAVLLGETGLEEVYEHLLLNRIDVSFLGPALVDGSIDLEDYFD
ncbi:pyridine nucleotide-disulfide oxidoreductase domain 1 [Cyanidiococcus yangmingshanensis]|uniref:Pyridine nucleotide-disulfide oxidoreductase domain 1 n=1 Tax=Cyanidiococcus yangmingshanensis TaxID=2690220 RepID=A0A7J7IQC6_9RHOD|nr:pyridine nucleotide-disulfide oxidoreductase domain 1 [Cyanidiococcus yangmingshanensis]